MASASCNAAIHLCAVRITRLDQLGNPLGGGNNVYVSDKQIMVNVTPQIEAGQDKTLTSGCDCIIATYRGFDKLKRFDLEVDQGVLEPALLEMMLGASAIVDDDDEVIGNWWPTQTDCTSPQQPTVCFEGWQTNWNDCEPEATYPYVHWIWPATRWSIDAHSLQNDFNQPKLKGYSRCNTLWGLGIFGDLPEEAGPLGGYFLDESIPTAECGYQTVPIT